MSKMLTVVQHPLIEHKLTLMRDKSASTASFRRLLREISMLLAYEVLRDLKMETVHIETPVCPMEARQIQGKKVCFVSVLRAGDGLLTGLLDLVPVARVGHIGLYRDPETLQPVSYYNKLVSAPEGFETFHAAHPDVPVYTAAMDEKLNEKGYIVPGLGDAGDRLFGTK